MPSNAIHEVAHIKYASILLAEEVFLHRIKASEQICPPLANLVSLQIFKESLLSIYISDVKCNYALYLSDYRPVLYLNSVISNSIDNFDEKCSPYRDEDEPASEQLLLLISSLCISNLKLKE